MEDKRIPPLRAIRLKCLDCCCGSSNEIKNCAVVECPLYLYREGKDPFRAKRQYTPEEKAALALRLRQNNPRNIGEKN